MFDSWWWTTLSLGMTAWVLGLSVWIVFERRSPIATVAWILSLSLLPLIGIAIYFVFGPRKFKRKKLRRSASALATRASHEKRTRISQRVDESLDAMPIIAMCVNAAGPAAHPRRAKTTLYTGGLELFAALGEAIEKARHHIHMEYYIWRPDEIGTRLRDALVAAAKRGVEVRILIDSFGSSKASDRFWQPLQDQGGHIERFNELNLRRWRPRLANFRTHRKIAVIDGRIGFTGGMNIADYHSQEFRGERAWRDSHLRLEGPAVRGLQLVFAEGWHYATDSIFDGFDYFPDDFDEGGEGELVQVVASGPDENYNAIQKLFLSAITMARQSVCLTSAYFVPGELMLNALATAVLRGADVRVLVPAENDVRLVAAASRSYYDELLAAGVRIFEYGPPMLHAKTLVVDNWVALVGTANADRRSFELNFEVDVVNYESAMCEQFTQTFHLDLKASTEITAEQVANDSFRARVFQNFARLLSPML